VFPFVRIARFSTKEEYKTPPKVIRFVNHFVQLGLDYFV